MAAGASTMALALAVGCFGLVGREAAAADNVPPQASAGPDAAQPARPLRGMHDSAIPARRPRFSRPEDYSSAKDWGIRAENLVPHGRGNPLYYPLVPGHRHIFERPDHPDGQFRMETLVLDELEPFDVPGIGRFDTATVQEEEFMDGILIQRSRNWFAIDRTNNNVYAFGEVSWEITSDGKPEFIGTWRAGEPDGNGVAEPGMLMPGTFVVGHRYIFDGSESESHGGSENMEAGMTVTVPAGTFENCVRVREQNLMDLRDITDKVYCPNVGIVSDTSDGKLVASSALPPGHPGSDVSSFGHFIRNPVPYTPPVAKVTTDQAQAIALQTIPGRVNSVAIERKRGKSVFTVEIITPNGQERDVFVDIESGEVVGTD